MSPFASSDMTRWEVVNVEGNKEIQRFIDFPRKLYEPEDSVQSPDQEQEILMGTHLLSGYFQTQSFLLCQNGNDIGRASLFFYPESPERAYLGFFEMEKERDGAAFFFSYLENYAKERGCRKISGPVNGSFWLGYRMKTNAFINPPYFGEPYNMPWYPSLWEENGYYVTDRYVSNIFPVFTKDGYNNPKYEKRLASFIARGYKIIRPNQNNWDRFIKDIYRMIVELYGDFPVFSPISPDDFCRQFDPLRLVLNFDFCRIAYYEKKPVGFVVTVPDYGNLVNGDLTWKALTKILARRTRCNRYVVLYMGVQPEHKGLGSAMSQILMEELRKRKASAVGALIHEGKVTRGYVRDYVSEENTYVMYEKRLKVHDDIAHVIRIS